MRYLSKIRGAAGLTLRFALGAGLLLFLLVTGRNETQVSALAGYSFGNENSWIRVQNIGSADAVVELNYFDELGKLAGKDACPSAACPPLFPGSGWTFFQR